ncbi:MAG: MoxR family ATPase, partial [Myxococcota bacterium]
SVEVRKERLTSIAPMVLRNLEQSAEFYDPNTALLDAINTAIALEKPLFLTGEPGVGKTQAASYIAQYFNIPLHKMSVRSTSAALDLLYTFDAVGYYRDAQLPRSAGDQPTIDRSDYIIPGPLWEAIRADPAAVLLVDEIDKAPRDFSNDLLDALDQFRFSVPELKYADTDRIQKNPRLQGLQLNENSQQWSVHRHSGQRAPIVVLTSNAENRLPEPFLRRCIFHEIRFDQNHLHRVLTKRQARLEATDHLVDRVIERAMELRDHRPLLKKPPSTAEILEWLYLLAKDPKDAHKLNGPLAALPYLEVLLKTKEDVKIIKKDEAP